MSVKAFELVPAIERVKLASDKVKTQVPYTARSLSSQIKCGNKTSGSLSKSGLTQGFGLRSSVRFYGILDAPCIFSRPDFGTLNTPCTNVSFCLQQNKCLNFFTFYYQSKNTEYS